MKTYPLNRQRGSLPLVMILILALSIAMMGVTSYVNTAAKIVTQAEAKIKASHAAEAALEKSMADLNAHALSIRPGTPDLAGVTGVCNLSTVPTTLFPSSQGYTFTRNIAVPIENGIPITTFTNASDATKTYHYVSEASVTYAPPGGGPTATVTMQRAFTHQVIPLFQYAIFFGGSATTTVTPVPGNGDLEINPGQNFTVGGRVHSNNNVYYGSNATLTFQGVVTSAMATPIYGRSPRDPRTGYYGNDATFNNGTPPISPYKVDFIAFPCSTATTSTNQSGPIEFVRMPNASFPDPNAKDREYNIAGIKILVNTGNADETFSHSGGNGTLFPRSGSGVPGIAKPTTEHCGFVLLTKDNTLIPERKISNSADYNDLYILFGATIGTQTGWPDTVAPATSRPILRFYNPSDPAATSNLCRVNDYRQGRMMLCTSLDVSKLARAVDVNVTTKITLPGGGLAKIDMKVPNTTDYGDAKDKPLWNGVVYIHDLASGTANNRKGVMLENGITLPTTTESTVARGGGLTVVTDHSAYIIGNYNTGGNPPVNSGAITDAATVAGYTVRPAAVMADAVNVLSRNWTIAYNSLSLGSRTPSSTTVNAALLSGNVPSTNPGGYSGGVENFPRLLEAWTSSIRLTIYGSMICLFPSIYATSRWGSSNVYDVPSRNWYFEPTFNNPNCLPPGTPNIVLFTNGEWVRLNN